MGNKNQQDNTIASESGSLNVSKEKISVPLIKLKFGFGAFKEKFKERLNFIKRAFSQGNDSKKPSQIMPPTDEALGNRKTKTKWHDRNFTLTIANSNIVTNIISKLLSSPQQKDRDKSQNFQQKTQQDDLQRK